MSESWRRALGARRLLVSGFGRWGGGVYDLTSGQPVALDDLPTSGLAVGGGRLWRALRAPGEQTASCELLSYDARGVRSYQRLDAVRDPHDLCWHDDALHVVSSWNGIVWRVGAEGVAAPVWRGGVDVPDSWHVNSLVVVDGRLHVCAFGRFAGHKAWKLASAGSGGAGTSAGTTGTTAAVDDRARRAAGFVHDIDRAEDVLRGLAHPHAPRRHGDRWYVCESTRGALTECGPDGHVRRRVAIQRFSRGLAIVDRWALVGGNAHRDATDDRAEIVVVDLRRFEVVARIVMPCLEVYDILTAPPELARGLALGFGGNPARAVEQHRAATREPPQRSTPPEARVRLVTPRTAARLATSGQELDPAAAARCAVRGTVPAQMAAGETRALTVTVLNRSAVPLATVPPRPLRIGARWLPLDRRPTPGRPPDGHPPAATDARDAAEAAGGRDAAEAAEAAGGGPGTVRNPMAPLPHLLGRNEQAEVEILLTAPDRPGRYEVRVALHQPTVGWFGVRLHRTVTVLPVVARPEIGPSPAPAPAAEATRPGVEPHDDAPRGEPVVPHR